MGWEVKMAESQQSNEIKPDVEYVDRVVAAQTYVEEEHSASAWQSLKDNPKIVALCFFATVGPLMYGFDNLATSLCLSMPAFQYVLGKHLMRARALCLISHF